MSRIDTQSDRLIRGAGGFQAQRSFLVQPKRFSTASTPGLARLGQAIGAGIATIKKQRDKIDAQEKQEELNSLVELGQLAKGDPDTYGLQFIQSYEASRERHKDDADFTATLLRLDPENKVESYKQRFQDEAENRLAGRLQRTFREIAESFDPNDPVLAGMSPNERRAEVRRRFEEDLGDEVLGEINNNDSLWVSLSDYITATTNQYNGQHTEIMQLEKQEAFEDSLADAVAQFSQAEDGSVVFGERASSMADFYNISYGEAENRLASALVNEMFKDLETGKSGSSILGRYNNLMEVAKNSSSFPVETIVQAGDRIVQELTQRAAPMLRAETQKGLQGTESLDSVRSDVESMGVTLVNTILGTDFDPDNTDLRTVDRSGLRSADLDVLDSVAALMDREQARINKIESDMQAARSKAKTDFEAFNESNPYALVREGDSRLVREYAKLSNLNPDIMSPHQNLFYGGASRQSIRSGSFRNISGKLDEAHKNFVEGNNDQMLMALGAFLSYDEDQVRSMASESLSAEEVQGIINVYQKAEELGIATAMLQEGVDLNEVFAQTGESGETVPGMEAIRSALSEAYTAGAGVIEQMNQNPVGSSSFQGVSTKKMGDLLGSKVPVSQALADSFSLYITRLDPELDLSEKELFKAFETHLASTGRLIINDGLTGMQTIITDPGRVHPRNHVSQEALINDLSFQREGPTWVETGIGALGSTRMWNRRREVTEMIERGVSSALDVGGYVGLGGTSLFQAEFHTYFDNLPSDVGEDPAAVAAHLTRQAFADRLDINQDELSQQAFYSAFVRGDGKNSLRLDVGMRNNAPVLIAVGMIDGKNITHENAPVLSDWNPRWNYLLDRTKEGDTRNKLFQIGALGFEELIED